MKIHEYQAKDLLRAADVAVPKGIVATTPDEAAAAFSHLGGTLAVVKAQIHAGGRGKGTLKGNPKQHGVELVRSADEANRVAFELLGQPLVTVQTGPGGQLVRRVFVEAGCEIARELYLGIVIDRARALPVLMASSQGGMNIEEVAAQTPELIFVEPFHPDSGLQPYQVRKLCGELDLSGPTVRSADKFMRSLCKLFVELDCSLAEINPLVVTKSGELMALDAKISFDDNALFRHPQLADLRDFSEEDPNELRAGRAGLSYVQLEGNIGCLVNGAGLAMSTMDLIKLHGGEPANFLDVGGGANAEQVTEAFRILLVRQEREGRAGQHLRRHHALHDDRQRDRHRVQRGRLQRAAGRAARRHRSGTGPQNPRRKRRGDYYCERLDRRGEQGCEGRGLTMQ